MFTVYPKVRVFVSSKKWINWVPLCIENFHLLMSNRSYYHDFHFYIQPTLVQNYKYILCSKYGYFVKIMVFCDKSFLMGISWVVLAQEAKALLVQSLLKIFLFCNIQGISKPELVQVACKCRWLHSTEKSYIPLLLHTTILFQ